MSEKYESTVDAIGNTPLIKLGALSEATGAHIYGKAEFMNPGGSVKDRAALSIVRAAEASGALKPGGTIVEGTAGNTGIGLTVVASALGYKTIIVIPNTQSSEKKNILRFLGAELIEVPAKPYSNPNNFQHIARRLAERLNKTNASGAIFADQFNNLANKQAHVDGTAPEIWEQTDGKIDGFVSAVGTGGTLSGVAQGLHTFKPEIAIALADPMGAALYSYYTTGELKMEGGSITEGIGQSRITPNLEGFTPSHQYQIPDSEAMPYVFDLMRRDGLCLGPSTGVNVAGAVRLAKDLGPGSTIVTLLCDSGTRYMSRLFNPQFLADKGIEVPQWLADAAVAVQPYDIPFEELA